MLFVKTVLNTQKLINLKTVINKLGENNVIKNY